jgi:hypothetical protein
MVTVGASTFFSSGFGLLSTFSSFAGGSASSAAGGFASLVLAAFFFGERSFGSFFFSFSARIK